MTDPRLGGLQSRRRVLRGHRPSGEGVRLAIAFVLLIALGSAREARAVFGASPKTFEPYL